MKRLKLARKNIRNRVIKKINLLRGVMYLTRSTIIASLILLSACSGCGKSSTRLRLDEISNIVDPEPVVEEVLYDDDEQYLHTHFEQIDEKSYVVSM